MKWLRKILLGLIGITLVALGVLYAWSGLILGKTYPAENRSLVISESPAVLAEGERLAQVFGCANGCHGKNMEGAMFVDNFMIGRFFTPSLTAAFDRFSGTELEAMIRQGIAADGKSLMGMPSASFSIMTDEDLTAVASYIAAYPPSPPLKAEFRAGPLGRLGLVTGEFQPAAKENIRQPWDEASKRDPMKLGEYMAVTACGECHGEDLQGQEDFTPPLSIAKAYQLDDFKNLLSTGEGLGGRDLGLMTRMTQSRFRHLTNNEVEALHAYLQTL